MRGDFLLYYELTVNFNFCRGEAEKALPVLEKIVENERLPSANVLTSLVSEFFEKNDVEACERGTQLSIDLTPHYKLSTFLYSTQYKVTATLVFFLLAVALIRRKETDEWGEQRLKHVLLMMYLKDNNYSAAQDIVEKVC